jgi:hypothetical protein
MSKETRKTIILLCGFAVVMICLFVRFFYRERQNMALLNAINAGDVPAARKAFRDGATMTMEIRHHFTFLQVAAFHTNVEIAKLLVEHGAERTLAAKNDYGATALAIANANGHTEMAEYLRSLTTTNEPKNVP